jgi:hypothetical protein
MARAAHPNDIIEGEGLRRGEPVQLPFARKRLWAPPLVMTAEHHRAFTAATCSLVDGSTKQLRRPLGHRPHPSVWNVRKLDCTLTVIAHIIDMWCITHGTAIHSKTDEAWISHRIMAGADPARAARPESFKQK